jgi:hypothetical protein
LDYQELATERETALHRARPELQRVARARWQGRERKRGFLSESEITILLDAAKEPLPVLRRAMAAAHLQTKQDQDR